MFPNWTAPDFDGTATCRQTKVHQTILCGSHVGRASGSREMATESYH